MRQNLHYAGDAGLGKALGLTLGKALFGDPQARAELEQHQAKLDYMGAQTRESDAHAGVYGEQSRGLGIQNGAAEGLPGIIASMFQPQPVPAPADPLAALPEAPNPVDGMKAGLPGLFASLAQMQGDKVNPNAIVGGLAAMFGTDEFARRGLVAQGDTPGEKFAITPERADDIRNQEFNADYAKSTAVAGINHATDIPVANIRSETNRYVADAAAEARRQSAWTLAEARRQAASDRASKTAKRPPKPLSTASYKMLFGDPNDADEPGELARQIEELGWKQTPDAGTLQVIKQEVVRRFMESGNPVSAVSDVLDLAKRRWDEKQAAAARAEQLRQNAQDAIRNGASPLSVAERFRALTGKIFR